MKVVLAVDGSRYSADALDAVATRPWPSGTTVRVLSVATLDRVLSVTAQGGKAVELERKAATKDAEELTTLIANSLRTKGLFVDPVVPVGDPREAIVNESKNWGANLIIIGAYGHSGAKSWSLGSVAESVVKHAPCSVEVVRKTSEEKE
jgi:nucleotide-binding universal stress UspA family protein